MKTLRTAVLVVAGAAAIASGVGAIIGATAFAGLGLGVSLATITAISTVASIASGILSMTAKKPSMSMSGSVTEYKLDPNAGVPYIMGRMFYAGAGIKRESWGKDNEYQGFTTVYSYGPIKSIQQFLVDRVTPIAFGAGGAAVGTLAGFMWFTSQLGLAPSPALASPVAGYPGWAGANAQLSGLAASNWVLKFDKNGKKFTSGPPAPGVVAEGVMVYDPRRDSTFPGGDGPCRAFDESTYVYSTRPALHGLTYAMGRYQNGRRRMGVGMDIETIDVKSFAEAANIEDANGWEVNGVLWSTDNKWTRLKQIGQAGCWEPIMLGGHLRCSQQSPRVSIATIDTQQITGKASVVGTQASRERLNGMIPVFRSEPHGWQAIPAAIVQVPEYVAADRGETRTEELPLEFVTNLKQATQITAYELVGRRESTLR